MKQPQLINSVLSKLGFICRDFGLQNKQTNEQGTSFLWKAIPFPCVCHNIYYFLNPFILFSGKLLFCLYLIPAWKLVGSRFVCFHFPFSQSQIVRLSDKNNRVVFHKHLSSSSLKLDPQLRRPNYKLSIIPEYAKLPLGK